MAKYKITTLLKLFSEPLAIMLIQIYVSNYASIVNNNNNLYS